MSKGAKLNCECFLNELEALPVDLSRDMTDEMLLERLPAEARDHAVKCEGCAAALRDLVETRRALQPMPELLPEAGPWFTRRVMQAITTQEQEIEERENGFWNGVRRLAPRVVAFATLLLMLGGTWAFQVRRASQSQNPQMSAAEGIFEAGPVAPMNDDIVMSVHEGRLP